MYALSEKGNRITFQYNSDGVGPKTFSTRTKNFVLSYGNKKKSSWVLLRIKSLAMVSSREIPTYPTAHTPLQESLTVTPTHLKQVSISTYAHHLQKAFTMATVLSLWTLYTLPWPYALVNYFIPSSPSFFLFKGFRFLFIFSQTPPLLCLVQTYFLEITASIIMFISLFPKPFPDSALERATLSWFPPHFSP